MDRSFFGSWLRSRRSELGLTLAQLSARTGLPVSTLHRWEWEHVPADKDKLPTLASALNVTLETVQAAARGEIVVVRLDPNKIADWNERFESSRKISRLRTPHEFAAAFYDALGEEDAKLLAGVLEGMILEARSAKMCEALAEYAVSGKSITKIKKAVSTQSPKELKQQLIILSSFLGHYRTWVQRLPFGESRDKAVKRCDNLLKFYNGVAASAI